MFFNSFTSHQISSISEAIRAITKTDLDDLKVVIETSGLFPSDLLDGMVADYFSNPETADIWLTKLSNEKPIAIAYCAPERLTDGTYNLYLIAVHKELQAKGIGGQMIQYIEELLRSTGQRILLVETSGLPEFELTRKFYDKCGYNREAVIRDFNSEGEDKVVFWKKLNQDYQKTANHVGLVKAHLAVWRYKTKLFC